MEFAVTAPASVDVAGRRHFVHRWAEVPWNHIGNESLLLRHKDRFDVRVLDGGFWALRLLNDENTQHDHADDADDDECDQGVQKRAVLVVRFDHDRADFFILLLGKPDGSGE